MITHGENTAERKHFEPNYYFKIYYKIKKCYQIVLYKIDIGIIIV